MLLLEAGPSDDDPDIHNVELTSLFAVWYKPQFDWGLSTVASPGSTAGRCSFSRAKSPAAALPCNGRIFIRGHRRDFDHWNYMGNENWSFDHVLPYFKKSEDYMGPKSDFRGVGGPLPVMDLPEERRSAASQAFVAGCERARVQE